MSGALVNDEVMSEEVAAMWEADPMEVGSDEAAVGWMRQCSKHLSHIEARLMEGEYLGHEVVRQIGILLQTFSPPPRGEWGWLLRQALDVAVRTTRQLARYYLRNGEEKSEFMTKAVLVVRLFFEEAWHRAVLGSKGKLMRSAMCSMIVSIKEFEENTLGKFAPDLGIFWTFTEAAVKSLAMRIGKGEVTSVEDMPSFHEVMQIADLRVEAFSLMMVRVTEGSIRMSKADVKAQIEAVTGSPLTEKELRRLPGTEEPSVFEELFEDEGEW